MRPFIRSIFQSFKKASSSKKRTLSTSPRMSGAGTAAALYAATKSVSSITEAVPEEAKDKKHHLKDGSGFTNPWESWRNMSALQIMKSMAWHVFALDPLEHGAFYVTNRIKAKVIRSAESSRYNASDRHGAETCLPPIERDSHSACDMARPCLLLC